MKWLGIAFALLGLIWISVERFAAEKKLTGNEIKSTRSGYTLRFKAWSGSTGEISYQSDGTMEGKKVSGLSDVGKWWVKDDKFCRQWENWRSGDRECFDILETGDKRYKAVGTNGGYTTSSWTYQYNSWMIK